MGVWYELINVTKREVISFAHIPAAKARELAGNPVSAAMVTHYLLNNLGDRIMFLPDEYHEWPCKEATPEEVYAYRDVTDEVVASLIQAEILVDEGIERFDDDDPTIYMRRLRNIWMEEGYRILDGTNPFNRAHEPPENT